LLRGKQSQSNLMRDYSIVHLLKNIGEINFVGRKAF
jgi:hypothetical protein